MARRGTSTTTYLLIAAALGGAYYFRDKLLPMVQPLLDKLKNK